MNQHIDLSASSVLSSRHWVWSFLHLTRPPDASLTVAADDGDGVEESVQRHNAEHITPINSKVSSCLYVINTLAKSLFSSVRYQYTDYTR